MDGADSGKTIRIALAGNPNSGKTTIFNNLTGAQQHVGNYPGVTVEKKEGFCRHGGVNISVTDLPGTYSLTAYSIEEVVARNFIIEEKPDVVVDILDASNLERNLYLAVQIMELNVPLVLAFNMSDVAEKRGIKFDLRKLSQLLGVPIVPTVGNKGRGMRELLDAALDVAEKHDEEAHEQVHYGREIEEEIAKVRELIEQREHLSADYSSRWVAVKLLEDDSEVKRKITSPEVLSAAERSIAHIENVAGDSPEIIIADRRYGFISGVCQEAVQFTVEARHTMSDRIDMVLTNRAMGLPIFLAMMYLVFQLTFTIGDPFMGWIESLFGSLGALVDGWWPRGSESALKSLLRDGIIGGVGGVIVFLPNILLLFMAIAFLEDSGYMARAAFIMDRLMHKIGLHGKSFIPMLIGFGCSVPAIMATRTLENRRDRLTTMLVTPLMSCGARLPIYALIIPAFFPRAWNGPVLWIIYLTGIILAILCAKLLRSTLFKGESPPFVMELPPYRLPTLKGLLIHTWERGWLYLRKAGTIILGISIVLWAMTSYPKKQDFNRDYAGLAARNEARFLAAVGALNSMLGLTADSETLVKAIRAESGLGAGRTRDHKGADGFTTAEKKSAVFAELRKRADWEAVARFLAMRDKVAAAREEFNRTFGEGATAKGTPQYVVMGELLERKLSDLEKEAPNVYRAVVKFLDEVEAPFRKTAEELKERRRAEELAFTVAGRIGHAMEPALRPMGFDWRIGTALIGALAAKEVFVAQMGIVFSAGEADENSNTLRERLRRNYSPLTAFCIMLFCLVSAPCMATIAVTKREANSWGWALFQLVGLTVLAYILTVLVYQLGSLLGLGVAKI